ncbi:MAG: hypothetical protein AzoDbin1_04250 [Azoarcus sp.]|nr:hypothetical protein [Azoarcus sp.]
MFELDESVIPGFAVARKDERQQLLLPDPDEMLEAVTVYGSGASNPAEFNGYATIGAPVGVVVGLLSGPVRQRLSEYVGDGGLVFCDSGVYSSGAPKSVDFGKVMERYAHLVESVSTPSSLLLVMPDVMGDYEGTLRLLRQYRNEIVALRSSGAEVIVSLQKGAANIVSGYDAVREALGYLPCAVGLPCKKDPWSLAEIRQLMFARTPDRVHLLGVGADRKKLLAVVDAVVGGASPFTRVSADSCRIRAWVGKVRPAPVTVATQTIRERAQHELGDIRPLLQRLWSDPAELCRVARQFGDEFGYGFDETEIIGELVMPGAFSLDELEWIAEHLTAGASPEEVAAIASYWYENGLVLEEMHELADELQRRFHRARQCAVEVVASIEKSGGRLRRSHTPMPLAA